MARASTRTMLSLDKYAKIMGISPMLFNGGYQIELANGETLFPVNNAQNDTWPQYSWQNVDQVSREDLARQIQLAEYEIVSFLGYYPMPVWTIGERHDLPRHYRPELRWQSVSQDVSLSDRKVMTNFSKFISGGRRGTTFIANVAITYSDPDGDGWKELATITCPTTSTYQISELKIYFAGRNGEPEYEIRDFKTKTYSANVLTITLNSWLLVDPDNYEVLPTDDTDGKYVDMSNTAIMETTVDVYREYNDTTQNHALFYTENYQTGAVTTQGGLIYRDSADDFVIPIEADYDSATSQWNRVYAQCGYPDYVDLWYYSGINTSNKTVKTMDDYLPDDLAMAIAYLTTARLERIYYSNNNATALASQLREDLSKSFTGEFRQIDRELVLSNPFGTLNGEVKAWRLVSRYRTALRSGGAL